MTQSILNIAGYRFVDLPDHDQLIEPFQQKCQRLHLKGTILLASEGINFFLAGVEQAIDDFVLFLEQDERLRGIPLKKSWTEYQPFNRMNVRRKKEIISVGMENIRPVEFTGPDMTPNELKEALDGNSNIRLLDTRNIYEMKIGTFENAIDLKIDSFRDFPKAIQQLPESMKEEPIVMFCTGGIRCEKASAIMIEAGFKNVRQLKGGILGYFEEVGGDHWHGNCFVFDQRVAVNPQLIETGEVVCFACRTPLTLEEQQHATYKVGVSCLYCAQTNLVSPK
jgi:UPF0176 protein